MVFFVFSFAGEGVTFDGTPFQPGFRRVVESAAVSGVFGREREIEALAAGLDDAARGKGRFFLLSGEAGIGKSAIARAIERIANDRGFVTVTARGWDGEGAPPYWPFIQILRALDRDRELDPSDDPRGRFATFDKVAGSLRDAAKGSPLLVVLDDLHVADPSSLSMLVFVVRELANARVMVVACQRERDGARGPNVETELARLARDATVLRLDRLERDAVTSLVASAKGAVPSPIVDLIWKTSEGVPLFVEEILRAMTAPGAAWVTTAPLPAGVRGAVRERLGRLDAPTRRVLEAASVIGRTFTLAIVSRILSEDVTELVEKAASADVVERLGPGRYGFAHAMLREALYRDISGAPRTKLHAAVLDALEAQADASIGERAHHALRAAPVIGVERAIGIALEAADAAKAKSAFEDAADILRRALGVLDLAPADAALRAKVNAALGRAQVPASEAPKKEEDTSPSGFALEREGELWRARRGSAVVRLKDSRGLYMLAKLVAEPGKELHCIALSSSGDEHGAPIPAGDSGDVLDREAIAAYRERLVEVEEELREAEGWNDVARVANARSEAEFLRAELSRAVGLGGRSRKSGADTERARVNCQRRIRDAVKRIGEQDAAMGKHLLLAVKTGTFCVYDPSLAP
jgi:hypothetical protein